MTSFTPVPIWRRVAAGLYDLFPLLAIWFFTGAISLLVTAGTMDTHHPPMWYRVFLISITASYFVLSWVRGGQTIGMRAWQIKIVRSDGSDLTISIALLRFVAALLSLGLFGLGFFWAFFDPQRRCWHDLAVGTIVRKINSLDENKISER